MNNENYTNLIKNLHTLNHFSYPNNLTTDQLVVKNGYDYLYEMFDHNETRVEKYIEKNHELLDLLNQIVALEVAIYCVRCIPGGTTESSDYLYKIRHEKIDLFNSKSKCGYTFYNKDVEGM